VREIAQAIRERSPIMDAIALYAHQVNVRGGTEQPLAQITAHSIRDSERNDERGNANGNSCYGNRRDHAYNSLSPLRFQVARCNKKLKPHLTSAFAAAALS
jgi:hypothetical protein